MTAEVIPIDRARRYAEQRRPDDWQWFKVGLWIGFGLGVVLFLVWMV